MTKMLDILQDFCEIKNLKYCRLDGSCSVENRHEQVSTTPYIVFYLLDSGFSYMGLNLEAVLLVTSNLGPHCLIKRHLID